MEREVLKYLDQLYEKGNPKKIQELVFDNMQIECITSEIKTSMKRFPNIVILSMNNCDMKRLGSLPKLKHLQRIELSYNQIPLEELKKLMKYPKLISLSLIENKLSYVQELKELRNALPDLQQLDLYGCPVTVSMQTYRSKLFSMFSKLLFLDNLDQRGEQTILSDREIQTAKLTSSPKRDEDHSGKDDDFDEPNQKRGRGRKKSLKDGEKPQKKRKNEKD